MPEKQKKETAVEENGRVEKAVGDSTTAEADAAQDRSMDVSTDGVKPEKGNAGGSAGQKNMASIMTKVRPEDRIVALLLPSSSWGLPSSSELACFFSR